MTELELAYYRLSQTERRKLVRLAVKEWRERHPEHASARPIHHGWYGWVMWSTVGESGAVADVLRDCVFPVLRRRIGVRRGSDACPAPSHFSPSDDRYSTKLITTADCGWCGEPVTVRDLPDEQVTILI